MNLANELEALTSEMMPDRLSVYLEGPSGDYIRLYECTACGAAVIDRKQHYMYHRRVDGSVQP